MAQPNKGSDMRFSQMVAELHRSSGFVQRAGTINPRAPPVTANGTQSSMAQPITGDGSTPTSPTPSVGSASPSPFQKGSFLRNGIPLAVPGKRSTSDSPIPIPGSMNSSQSPENGARSGSFTTNIEDPDKKNIVLPMERAPSFSLNSPLTPKKTEPEEAPTRDLADKSFWYSEAIKNHPEILEIMERVRPLNRAVSFGRLYTEAKTPIKDEFLVGRDTLLQLIMQHLTYEGLKGSRKVLEEESATKYLDHQLSESRLLTLLRLAVKDTERVWELTLSNTITAMDTQQLLEEHLCDMGLLQEDLTTQEAEDVNIWDEPEEGNIIFAEEKDTVAPVPGEGDMLAIPQRQEEKVRSIKAASLNKLIVMLTPEKNHDMEYVKTFLLTYQSFTTPAKLLQKLIQRYHVPIKEGLSEEDMRKISTPIQLRVVNVIRNWIKDHWSDFNDKLVASLKAFIDNTLKLDGNQQLVKPLTQALNNKLRPEEDEDKRLLIFKNPPPEPKVPKTIFSPQLDLFDIDEEEIARQLTLIDFDIYSSIKPSELLNQSWNKPKLKHRSPNVLRTIARFNEISNWVAASILRVDKVRDRARIMAKLVRIAEYLFKSLNNFNTAMAILAGLNYSSVHRLKYTREEMPKHIQQVCNELQSALSSNQSYKEYRNLLSRANPPCIPYLGVYLTDLTFIEDGNPDHILGLINFFKRKLVYNVISQVKQYQLLAYNLQPVHQIACLLWKPTKERMMDDDEQYRLSLLREPRNKDRSEIL